VQHTSVSILFGVKMKELAQVLLCGVEYDLLLFEILLYSVVDLAGNTPVSLLVTFIVGKLLKIIRAQWGQKNLSNKTLVDGRFLF